MRHFLWDKNLGSCKPDPWGIRKSDGADVQQIITDLRLSKLQMRSLAHDNTDENN